MASDGSLKQINCLSNFRLDMEIEKTYTLKRDPVNKGKDLSAKPSNVKSPKYDNKNVSNEPSDLHEAISSNINKILNNTSLSIYGGSSGIWMNTSKGWNDTPFKDDASTCRSCAFEMIFLRSFKNEYNHVYKGNHEASRCGGLTVLSPVDITTLSERLIEEALRTAVKLQPQEKSEPSANGQSA
ncbi:uncharacterized protein BXIN_0436 [Babesia sp. Xinjiang]|uniref:uncharacterized protein n=1 Tax=Babesia sp. Xinjiang TaxID=462227 RepID=UPI000A223611|nr:uncharacterized protein BXIN_0436 [Babesia sp. Xinjiang]ORM41041.1 hypothetical protein BXIN_0436 [Babesia sp. Xinjiang]